VLPSEAMGDSALTTDRTAGGDGGAEGGRPRLVIVAGGVGVAPFPLLLDSLVPHAGNDHLGLLDVLVLLGFRDGDQATGSAPLEGAAARLRAAGGRCSVEVCTEDGSRGPKQLVTGLLCGHVRAGDRVVACGPRPMMDAVWRVCGEAGVDQVWFSLETHMACGVGSCHGCVVELAGGRLARVCREGPVFAGTAVYGGMSL
jgi:NAD(P)H-flavin reductase